MAHERLLHLPVPNCDHDEPGFGGSQPLVVSDLPGEVKLGAGSEGILPEVPPAPPAQGDPAHLPLEVPVHGPRLGPAHRIAEPTDDRGRRGRLEEVAHPSQAVNRGRVLQRVHVVRYLLVRVGPLHRGEHGREALGGDNRLQPDLVGPLLLPHFP